MRRCVYIRPRRDPEPSVKDFHAQLAHPDLAARDRRGVLTFARSGVSFGCQTLSARVQSRMLSAMHKESMGPVIAATRARSRMPAAFTLRLQRLVAETHLFIAIVSALRMAIGSFCARGEDTVSDGWGLGGPKHPTPPAPPKKSQNQPKA